jgi:CubicO group peptidase (beta-lactamase class C family)
LFPISVNSCRGSRTPLLLLLFVTIHAISAPTPDWTAQADAYLKRKLGDRKFMGAVLISRNEQVLFKNAYGWADAEWEVPNTTDTIFRLGSLSKQFTAAAVVQLAQQGKLKLDDPVWRYDANLPETWKSVTLHQLLSHTSGIPNYTSQSGFWPTIVRPYTPQELVNVVREKPLDFTPGSRWAYSNTNYILLGIVIEKVSGRKYADYMREEVFRPLHMQNSGYDSPTPLLKHRAHGYVPSGNTMANAPYIDMTVPYSAGALYSTVDDLLKWDQALSGEVFLKRE